MRKLLGLTAFLGVALGYSSTAQAGEVTRVASSAEEDNPFDLHAGVSYDFDFNKGDRFLTEIGGKRAKDINLITNWADKSKTRNTIGYEMMRMSGHPAHYAFPVRVQQNATFFSTADLIEDGDDRYLDRVDLDGEGALYKMYNSFTTASGANKKTRKEEDN